MAQDYERMQVMEELLLHIERFLSHPMVWGVATLIAIGLAISGKFSVTAASWFMWAAWMMAVFGVYRATVYYGLDTVIRLLTVACAACGLAIVAVGVNRWINGPKTEAAAPVSSVPSVSEPHAPAPSRPSPVSSALPNPSKPTRPVAASPIRHDLTDSSLGSMSNMKLKGHALIFVKDLLLFGKGFRDKEKKLDQQFREDGLTIMSMEESHSRFEQNSQRGTALSEERTTAFGESYRGRAKEFEREMLRRIPLIDQPTEDERRDAEAPLDRGVLAGPQPIENVAEYLKLLAGRVPVTP